ncbi:MAG: hypothetical protein KatS3mg022_0267 [Armatimonadota bacterium]|nr:MAG: hypothetical protein KatS3mg022_0267 [Armatimonadota bacterium]
MAVQTATHKKIVYPESDGKPIADNTKQLETIVYLYDNLCALFADREDVFVAADLLWYPVEGRPDIRTAPDVMVVFGRPKGHRGSYKQWEEADIAPQVVFEVLSPGNRPSELIEKFGFYERYGVEEYYLYDPDRGILEGWIRSDGHFSPVREMEGWVSARLGVRFTLEDGELVLYRPDGERFVPYVELRRRLDEATRRAERLAQRLRELGIDPEQV